MKKILVIIPAYNEAENIVQTLRDVKASFPIADILVINDASSDQTSVLARREGVSVLDMPYNFGIGKTMQTGYLYAREFGYEIAVQVDADGQHRAKELPYMLETIDTLKNKKTTDIVIASRFLGLGSYKPAFLRKVGIHYFSMLIFCLTGKKITDPTSGFRMLNRRAIELFADNYAEDYPEPEAAVLALKKGLRIVEIPAIMDYRKKGKSSITPLRAIYYMVKVTMAILRVTIL